MTINGERLRNTQNVNYDQVIGDRELNEYEELDRKLANLSVEEAKKLTPRQLDEAAETQWMIDSLSGGLLGS